MAKLNLCIINKCNRNCDFCFEGAFKKAPEQRMSVVDVGRVCDFARIPQLRAPGVSIMGGEPTLHPQLTEIVRSVRQMNPTAVITLLTNLICDPDLLRALAPFGANCLVNVGGFLGHTPEQQEQVLSNLALLRSSRVFRELCLAVTIVDENQDFGFLYDILERDRPRSITALRVAIANPGEDFANRFPREPSLGFGEKYLELVVRCHRIKPLFTFVNECFVSMCMMSESVCEQLSGAVLNLIKPCAGTIDVLPDLSTHWCFAFRGVPEMCIRNLFEYRNMDEVCAVLRGKLAEMEAALDRQCDTENCVNVKCIGPCPAVKYYRKHVKK